MKMLNEALEKQLKDVFESMVNEVTLALFTQEGECYSCKETENYMSELSQLTPKLKLKNYDLNMDNELARKYKVEMAPSIVLLDSNDEYKGIKFNGIPAGHEINSLIPAILEVSGAVSEVQKELQDEVDKIKNPVNIKVFVTLSCPHCAGAVQKAHKLALMNKNIDAEMIEAETFGELSDRFNVSSVPKIVINDKYEFVGNQPIQVFLSEISKTQ